MFFIVYDKYTASVRIKIQKLLVLGLLFNKYLTDLSTNLENSSRGGQFLMAILLKFHWQLTGGRAALRFAGNMIIFA